MLGYAVYIRAKHLVDRNRMRWFIGIAAAIVIFILAYLGSAAVSLAGLIAAAREGDGAAVIERIDVPALSRSLTNQIVAAYLERIGTTRRISPMEKVLVNTYGATIADAMVAKMLTAERLSRILKTGNLDATPGVPNLTGLPALADLHDEDWLSLLGRLVSCNRCYSPFVSAKHPTRTIMPPSICITRVLAGSCRGSFCPRPRCATSRQACRSSKPAPFFERAGPPIATHLFRAVDNLVDADALTAQGGHDQPEISHQVLCPDILRIQLGEANGIRHIDALDLGEPGDTRPHVKNAQSPPRLDQVDLGRQARPGAHQAHIANHHVP
jgi:hypothetical protein